MIRAKFLMLVCSVVVLGGGALAPAQDKPAQDKPAQDKSARDEPAQETAAEEAAALPMARDDEGRVVNFARDIAPIFRTQCLDCHGPDDAKNDFRVDDRQMVLDYLEPEDASSSTLYVDYMTIDDEDMLMPPRSHGGPLSAGELALVRVWIDEGADWPESVSLVVDDAGDGEIESVVPPAPRGLVGRLWAAQGFLHPAIVHFPIALLTLGAAFVVLGWKWPSVGTQIPLACLLIGAVSSVAATLMGWSFAVEQGYGSWNRFDASMMDREVFWHRWCGVLVSVLALIFAIVALLSVRSQKPGMIKTWKAGLLVCAGIVGAVGHQGGEMSYGKDFYPKMFRILQGTDGESIAVESERPESTSAGSGSLETKPSEMKPSETVADD